MNAPRRVLSSSFWSAHAATLITVCVWPASAGDAGETRYPTGPAREALLRHLDASAGRYDPDAGLVIVESVPARDYTKLEGRRAHPTRESIGYAVELLEANDAEHRQRACRIIRKVLSLQDTDRGSLTYGLWPWYAEEPLGKMFMPDFNWAAFIGKTLLTIIIHHEHQLPADLREDIHEALRRACECIRRRPLHMGYTNIASMSSYVTLVAGERLGDPNLLAYGRWLFDRWYDYTMLHGSFTEFNSPTYTRVALGVVSRMMADFLDAERRAKAETINRMLWLHWARRLHLPTWQWAGPYSRTYDDFPGCGFRGMLRRRADGGADLVLPQTDGPDLANDRAPYRPPADALAPYLRPLTGPRQEVEVFFRAGNELMNGLGLRSSRVSAISLVGTTYLHPVFALGTVNFMDFWEQHRVLMAHWGAPERPVFMNMLCRNGRHGFCSAFFAGVQRGSDVLAGVVFATDFGDRFIDLDKLRHQTLRTRDLRIEFQIGGYLDDARIPERFDPTEPVAIRDRDVEVHIRLLAGTFAQEPTTAEIKRRAGRASLTWRLYAGPEKEFRLPDLGEAFALFSIRICPTGDSDAGPADVRIHRDPGACRAESGGLLLEVPTRPLPVEELQKRLRATVDGRAASAFAQPLLPAIGS